MIDTKAFIVDGNELVSEQRNEEEKVGLEKKRNINAEDFFIKKCFGILGIVHNFKHDLEALSIDTMTYENVQSLVEKYASKLWTEAKSAVQSGTYDDRPLYWARIKMEVALKNHLKGKLDSDIENLIQLFEEKSRNYTGINFSKKTDNSTGGKPKKKILITGFDPFGLNVNIEQSNPSGVVALALHGTEISDEDGNIGEIQAMIFPVRYEDFDKGYVEQYIYPYIPNVHMIVTISQGYKYYDIERFASKKRTSKTLDNLAQNKHIIYYNIENGILTRVSYNDLPEFLETTLPKNSIVPGTLGNNIVVYNQFYLSSVKQESWDWSYVLQKFVNEGTKDIQGPSLGEISVEGSGGDFLSNEIFYRVSLLREQYNSTLKTGHLHLPIIQYYQAPFFSLQKTRTEVENTKIILQDALDGLS